MPASLNEEVQRVLSVRKAQEEAQRSQDKLIDEHLLRIRATREEINTLALRLQEESVAFRSLVRRTSDEATSANLMFANAHLRCAGTVQQTIKRMVSFDRTAARGRVDQEEARVRDQVDLQKRAVLSQKRKEVQTLQLRSDGAMEELYGDLVEETHHA